MAEKKKALSPARTASDNSVKEHVGTDVAPDHGRQDLVGILAQFEHPRGIGVAGIGLELQAQLTKAEDRQR